MPKKQTLRFQTTLKAGGTTSLQRPFTRNRPVLMKRKRQLIVRSLIGCAVVLFIAAELLVRFGIGLGDPPLWRLDPKIEYIAKPGDHRRFGNRIHYNAYSMRSDEFPETKSDPEEIRVLVIGDSVVNGGNYIDQADLATEIAVGLLEQKLDRPVVIGNISAGSWGPRNQLEYLRHFGTFGADLVILVSHTGEVDDLPTHDVQLGVTHTKVDTKPLLALQEFFGRYVVQFFEQFKAPSPDSDRLTEEQGDAFEFSTRPDMEAMDELITNSGADFRILLHPRGRELNQGPTAKAEAIEALARERNIPLSKLDSRYRFELTMGNPIYMIGDIHLNERGQQLLAKELVDTVYAWTLSSEKERREDGNDSSPVP